jgi:ABC-type uncharacterized transport system substrate-binding protein
MKNKKLNKKLIYIIIGILLIGILISSYFVFRNPWQFRENRPVKILWINSYEEDFAWSQSEISGFKEVFDEENIDYELREYHMNTKSDPSEENKIYSSKEAMSLISSWEPDLIYATDDNAQKYVGVNYINSNLPIIFSGVNAKPVDYGYNNAKNIAGVIERESVKESFEFFREFYPHAKKVGVIVDDSVTGEAILNYVRTFEDDLIEYEFIEWYIADTFEDYKSKIHEYNKKADVVFSLAIDTLEDEDGQYTPLADVAKWNSENNNIPEITLWEDNIIAGFFLGVPIIPYLQGFEAGKLAKQILIDGDSPNSFPTTSRQTAKKIINLARAETLGIKREYIPSIILINSEIIEKFPWEEE